MFWTVTVHESHNQAQGLPVDSIYIKAPPEKSGWDFSFAIVLFF